MDQQNQMLNMLLSPGMLYNLNQRALKSARPYPVSEYLQDLQASVWKKFSGDPVRDTYRRALQRGYLEKLNSLINPKDMADGKMMSTPQRGDARILALSHIRRVRAAVASMAAPGNINQEHLQDMLREVDKIIAKSKK
jgi:hypothetical protein